MATRGSYDVNERRRSQRFVPGDERFGRVKATLPARIVDISRQGAQLEVPAALRPMVECDLTVPVADGMLRLRARVQRCRAVPVQHRGEERALMYRAGLEFLNADETALHALEAEYGPHPAAPAMGVPAEEKRRGPVKIRVDSKAIRRRVEEKD